MSLRKQFPAVTAAFLLLAISFINAELQADDEISVAAKQVAKEARREDYRTILVVVRQSVGSQSDPELAKTLTTISNQFVKAIQAEKLQADVSPAVDKQVARARSTTALKPADISRFMKLAKFDAALVVEYRKRGRQRTLKLDLLDYQESLWKETIRLQNFGLQARKKNAKPNKTNSPGTANPAKTTEPGRKTAGKKSSPRQTSKTGKGKSITGFPNLQEIIKNKKLSALSLNVLRYAISQFGKQVGNGECWTLADQALRAAGAQPARGYTFGKKIPLNQIQPGDILQFTSVRIERGNGYYFLGAPNHTAVVHSVSGNTIRILHQNFGTKTVTAFQFDLKNMTQGSIEAFRPVLN